MSFKFIAVAYGMLGATAATGFYMQGGGGGGMGAGGAGHSASPPKVERVAKLELPPKLEPAAPAALPTPAPVAAPAPEMRPVPDAPVTVTASVMPLTAPPTPPPPPPEVIREEAPVPVTMAADPVPAPTPVANTGFARGYVQITDAMTVNPWTGAWLTSDDRSMGYLTGPATVPSTPVPAPVMVAEAEKAPVEPPPVEPPSAKEEAPVVVAQASAAPESAVPPVAVPVTVSRVAPAKSETAPATVPVARASVIDQTAHAGHKAASGPYMAHLASYRDEPHALAGWKTIQKAHRDLLINRSPVTVTAEIPGQGTFVRLMTDGFTQLAEVSEFCGGLKAAGLYCTPMKGK
ncbi:hypothetical protein N825_16020 [Skermanella stibiiresistens SB22]|uniref:SPOR domain-containing protein n=1 Tax=Skermanella stibiiresistens SB22 TaxID=1385369 RepID=W9H2B5_9PROT|nr:hypothetical protein [Skermanella stibiiresistens]EWY37908.1 hypothetical protein N825_16020 [Skermanella stibiiresistens SB22]